MGPESTVTLAVTPAVAPTVTPTVTPIVTPIVTPTVAPAVTPIVSPIVLPIAFRLSHRALRRLLRQLFVETVCYKKVAARTSTVTSTVAVLMYHDHFVASIESSLIAPWLPKDQWVEKSGDWRRWRPTDGDYDRGGYATRVRVVQVVVGRHSRHVTVRSRLARSRFGREPSRSCYIYRYICRYIYRYIYRYICRYISWQRALTVGHATAGPVSSSWGGRRNASLGRLGRVRYGVTARTRQIWCNGPDAYGPDASDMV